MDYRQEAQPRPARTHLGPLRGGCGGRRVVIDREADAERGMTPRDATVGSPLTSEDGKAQRASGTPAGQGAKPDHTACVDDVYHEVEGVIQDGMDRLAKRRNFPILG